MDRRLTGISRRSRPIAQLIFATVSKVAATMPARVATVQAKQLPASDAAAIDACGDWFGRAIAEGTRNGAGVVDDYLAAVAPWGFDLGEIAVPTAVYQGTADSLVPPAWGEQLAAAIPGARCTTYDGEGHMIALSHRMEMVRDLH